MKIRANRTKEQRESPHPKTGQVSPMAQARALRKKEKKPAQAADPAAGSAKRAAASAKAAEKAAKAAEKAAAAKPKTK